MRRSLLQPLAQDLRAGTRPALLRAARRVYALAFVALALPGLPLGGLYHLTAPPPVPLWAVLVLTALGVGLAALATRLAARAAHDPALSPDRAALTAAIQAASAPGSAFLVGCGLLGDALGMALLWTLALATAWAGWTQLAGWVRDPQAAPAPA